MPMPKDAAMSRSEGSSTSERGAVEPWSSAATRNRKVDDAMKLYRKARLRAWLGKLKSAFNGDAGCLPNLKELKANKVIQNWKYIGVQEVPIHFIVGTEEPCQEFDIEFSPLEEHNQERWLDLAFAKLSGIHLPPIELIQVPDGYFAQSGLYRISVLRTMGEKMIPAYVTSWELVDRIVPSP